MTWVAGSHFHALVCAIAVIDDEAPDAGGITVACGNRRLAERVAELLERHGLADIPDDVIASITKEHP